MSEKLARLRKELTRQKLDGFIVPMNDEYNNEYVPDCAKRIAWLSGFTGSAGTVVVMAKEAALFTDGRYTLQAGEQVNSKEFSLHHSADTPYTEWLGKTLREGERLGFDPWLHAIDNAARLKRICDEAGAELIAVAKNPLDTIWTDQPLPPCSPVTPHPLNYAGERAANKRRRLAAPLREAGLDAVVLTAPDSLAWLLNIRGRDIAHTPFALGFAILKANASLDLFIDPRKISAKTRVHLGKDVTIEPIDRFGTALDHLGKQRAHIQIDAASAAAWIGTRLTAAGARLHKADDPCALPKACKNQAELSGARTAHVRDGAAVVRFLAWLSLNAEKGGLNEITAADQLAAFRKENALFQDLSFPTISGAGPNGAIVHYHATTASNRAIKPGSLYLVDSGAQYLDGTTDITRTVAIGKPTKEMRDRFTRVLKGHIALARCRFPVGTTGSQLDVLARHALWQAGLDYDHGTGHGVGSFLSVHEGPHRISKAPNTIPLKPGMIVSNEPGYYKAGAFGIRIENLVAVREAPAPEGAERPLLEFETLTRAPIDRNAIDKRMLTGEEVTWLNDYHAAVNAELSEMLDNKTRAWLKAATAPI